MLEVFGCASPLSLNRPRRSFPLQNSVQCQAKLKLDNQSSLSYVQSCTSMHQNLKVSAVPHVEFCTGAPTVQAS